MKKITDLVTIRIKDKENVLRDVAAGEPITFHVVYHTHKNVPQIAEFTINNKILCKEEDSKDCFLFCRNYFLHFTFSTRIRQKPLSSEIR